MKKYCLFMILGLLLVPVKSHGDDLGMKVLSWGLTLEELNRVYQEKVNPGAALREDSAVYEIELQMSPNKTQKIPRGGLTAVQETTREAGPTAVGKPFGYLWEGKFFGRVLLYANKPGVSRTQMARNLKDLFPEGRLFHKFAGGLMITDFELNSDKLTIFTNERGVFFYEPAVLKRVIREEGRSQQEREYREGERLFLERGKSPI
ncbi:MAG: hypothetical protein HY892_18080 [Deltaproteobacteria bacterium]|nr:hypothetical protein [Deltaproteobacteria bacterium]